MFVIAEYMTACSGAAGWKNLGLAVMNCSVETTVVGGTGAREHIDWFYRQENFL